MITTIESNCATGEVKYFDENGIEIDLQTALLEIESIKNVEVTVAAAPEEITTVSTEIPN